MFKTVTFFLAVSALVLSGTVPVLAAKMQPAGKHPAPNNHGFVYVTKGLSPGHRYRISVASTGRTQFGGRGFENYTWINQKHSGESTKPLVFTGYTPKSFVISQPVSAKLISWILALSISDSNFHPLRVTFKDLGTHK